MNSSNTDSTFYSTPFKKCCREEKINTPDDVALESFFNSPQKGNTAGNLLVVDLLMHPLFEERTNWVPPSPEANDILDHLERILIPHLQHGGVVVILYYGRTEVQSRRGRSRRRNNQEWFSSAVPIGIEPAENQGTNSNSIDEKVEQYFRFVGSNHYHLNIDTIPDEFVEELARTDESDPVAVAIDHYKKSDSSWQDINGRTVFLPRPAAPAYNFNEMIRSIINIGRSYVPREKKYQSIDKRTAPEYSDKQSIDEQIELVLSRFLIIAKQLEERYNDRETLRINDEYDVQDLLHALLRLFFQDVRSEEWAPSYAGTSPRVDFLIKNSSIGIELKMARSDHPQRKIKEELAIDKDHYRAHPDCNNLVCFVYDPNFVISNPTGFEDDISEITDSLKTSVLVHPKYN